MNEIVNTDYANWLQSISKRYRQSQICKTKDNTMVKWALESSQQPIGVSEYRISEILPKEIASDLPSIADIESAVGGVG